MIKLKLENIKKTYKTGEIVTALKGISLEFRESEFLCILGPSGCGKTTLLNIIGGLDRYDSGDLIIDGISTKKFKDKDWDAYRNKSIGFVFQTYNLITHQTVLQNVEISLTLSGISLRERRKRARKALEEVGLLDQEKKKPNQLSGGQMQRVAIARALVNNPDIILADEPTGALDSQTSLQIMEILKEIAKTRLVVMVTHNKELADSYSNRIVNLLDGEVQADTNPVKEEGLKTRVGGFKRTSMSFFAAAFLSFKNLLTKRGRTVITAFAGSIGIIGVALVLALSNGLTAYMNSMQSETLSGYPITINAGEENIDFRERGGDEMDTGYEEYPEANLLYSYDSQGNSIKHSNLISEEYLNYIKDMDEKLSEGVNNIAYSYGIDINLLVQRNDDVFKFNTANQSGIMAMISGNSYWQELPASSEFTLSMYELIGEGSRLPISKNEIVLVVDKYNRLDKEFFEKLGFKDSSSSYELTDFIGQSFLKVIPNDDFYNEGAGGLFVAPSPGDYTDLFNSNKGEILTVVGILRPKEGVSSSYLTTGIGYTPSLMEYIINEAHGSKIAEAQRNSDRDVLLGIPFVSSQIKEEALKALGSDVTPTGISIYPKSYESKDKIKEFLDAYNEGKEEEKQLIYSDMAETITSLTGTLLNTVTYVLVGFAGISLVVSTIMISIITYVSVIERTKEIGILRSVGARKKDISRVFNAETVIIGFMAGVFGVGLSYLLTFPINAVILKLVDIEGIAVLDPLQGAALIIGSMILTLVAGFIPSRMAAKKDPVVALRTE